MQLALDFYGPMYLLYSVYDAAEEKETVAPMLARPYQAVYLAHRDRIQMERRDGF